MTRLVHISKKADLIDIPASKSFAQRALFAAALSDDKVHLKNLGQSQDVIHIKSIIQQLGFSFDILSDDTTSVLKTGQPTESIVNVGESGLGTRLATPILSHFFQSYTVKGKGSLLKRPMTWFKTHLPQMGLDIDLNDQYLPLNAHGKLNAGHYSVDGSQSSQYISGLLMMLPLCHGNSILEVNQPTSTPYIDITLDVMRHFGIHIEHEAYSRFSIQGHQQYHSPSIYNIEGDFSSAAFWIVYGLLNDGIRLRGLNQTSVQADAAILNIVNQVGGSYEWKDSILHITVPKNLQPFDFDATHCPDLFPILVVLAAGINGTSKIKGTKRLINKESDRKSVLLKEFSKLGLEMKSNDNAFMIHGTQFLKSGIIDSHNDHRIAMACSIASFLTPNGLTISDPECVNKSYPEFWHTVQNL